MKHIKLLPLTLSISFFASCSNKGGDNFYDVSNPYAAPDYAEAAPAPSLSSDVNPAYNAPALYEDNSATDEVTPEAASPALSTSQSRPKITPPKLSSPSKTLLHTVVRGDTLSGIAQKYKVPASAIKQVNKMKNDTVMLGTKLRIPAP